MDILHPPGWARPKGYSNGISASGRMVFVSGMVGWDAQERFHAADLVGQVRQVLANIVAVLGEGGARPEHIVRMTWYLRDKRAYLAAGREIGDVWSQRVWQFYDLVDKK